MATLRFHAFMGGDGVTTGEVHWSAVVAGILVALVGQVLLTLLGTGLGATAFDDTRADTIAVGAFAWWAVAGIACGFAGGWAAGWVADSAPSVDRIEGAFQALLSWAGSILIVTLVIFTLAASTPLVARMAGPMSYSITRTVERASEGSPRDREVVSDVAMKGALSSFVALVIGLIAAMGGGYFGTQHAKRMIAASGRTATTSSTLQRAAAAGP
jgi:hypothetical protein